MKKDEIYSYGCSWGIVSLDKIKEKDKKRNWTKTVNRFVKKREIEKKNSVNERTKKKRMSVNTQGWKKIIRIIRGKYLKWKVNEKTKLKKRKRERIQENGISAKERVKRCAK